MEKNNIIIGGSLIIVSIFATLYFVNARTIEDLRTAVNTQGQYLDKIATYLVAKDPALSGSTVPLVASTTKN